MNAETIGFLLVVWAGSAWLTHVVACIKTTSWALLIIGSIVFPISWVHGTGLWLGIF
jgi:hypothetical protein